MKTTARRVRQYGQLLGRIHEGDIARTATEVYKWRDKYAIFFVDYEGITGEVYGDNDPGILCATEGEVLRHLPEDQGDWPEGFLAEFAG